MKLLSRLGREPVLIGAVVLQAVDVAIPDDLLHDPSPANIRLKLAKVLAAGVVALFVRAFSSPKQAVNEAKDAGYNAAVAEVSALKLPPPPLPPRVD